MKALIVVRDGIVQGVYVEGDDGAEPLELIVEDQDENAEDEVVYNRFDATVSPLDVQEAWEAWEHDNEIPDSAAAVVDDIALMDEAQGPGLPSMDRARAIAQDVADEAQRQEVYDRMEAPAQKAPKDETGYIVEVHEEWDDDYRYLVLDFEGNIRARCCDAHVADYIAEALPLVERVSRYVLSDESLADGSDLHEVDAANTGAMDDLIQECREIVGRAR